MSVFLVCPCGKRWSSKGVAGASALICPDCGQPLTPIVGGGWHSLWPRLTIAAAATLLVVVGAGFALIRLLPAARHGAPAEAPGAISAPPREAELHKPFPQEKPKKPLLLDNQPAGLPLLEDPPPTPTAKLSGVKPLETPLPQKGVLELPTKDDFFQHVVISRVSHYRVLDLEMGQNVQYVFVSRFHVKKKNDDGGMVVEQKVESVQLSNADPALQERLNELLHKTKGASFIMTVDAKREVTKFEGGQEAIKVFRGDNPLGGPSFLLWSFLDRDGWKELAQLSLFQPPPPSSPPKLGGAPRRSPPNLGGAPRRSPPNLGGDKGGRGERWDRYLTHSWGALGSWAGKIHYQSGGREAGLDRFDYALELVYKPPSKGGGLPFEIGKSQFQIEKAHGAIAYQPSRKRVAAAEERFHVRGLLTVSFLGVESTVQMDESQLFQLRILDKNLLETTPMRDTVLSGGDSGKIKKSPHP